MFALAIGIISLCYNTDTESGDRNMRSITKLLIGESECKPKTSAKAESDEDKVPSDLPDYQ